MRLAAPPPPPLLLLLLLLAGPPGARSAVTTPAETESTTETEVTTTETTTETTETTTESTTESTTERTVAHTPPRANSTAGTNNTAGANGTAGAPTLPPSRSPRPLTPSPPSGNSTTNGTAKSTAVPVSVAISLPRGNGTGANGPGPVTTSGTTTERSSETAPAPAGPNGTAVGAAPTGKGSASGAKATTAVLASGNGSPKPSKAAAPGALHLLLRVPLAFRVLNRDFSERLLDPASPEYAGLSQRVLAMLNSVFGCAGCASRQAYRGCSSLQFSQGSVLVHSELVFEPNNGSVSGAGAEKQLRDSLDPSGFIMGLQLSDIQSTDWSGTEPAVPPWAIALLVLVSVLVLFCIIFCLLTTCSCRRKSRGKLDLFSTKDSYHPAAEYPPYQSHGRYAAPGGKHSPYSQVAGSAGAGTFTYTNPAAGPDKP